MQTGPIGSRKDRQMVCPYSVSCSCTIAVIADHRSDDSETYLISLYKTLKNDIFSFSFV